MLPCPNFTCFINYFHDLKISKSKLHHCRLLTLINLHQFWEICTDYRKHCFHLIAALYIGPTLQDHLTTQALPMIQLLKFNYKIMKYQFIIKVWLAFQQLAFLLKNYIPCISGSSTNLGNYSISIPHKVIMWEMEYFI
jgi:hypothetical protein